MQFDSENSLEFRRLTTSVDTYDKEVITLMTKKKNQSYSEVIRYIVHNWIENYPDILKGNYKINLNNLSVDLGVADIPQLIQNSNESSQLFRFAFSLGPFDNKVITLMSEIRQQSRSEIVRNLVHGWIGKNSDILMNEFDIDVKKVREEIENNRIVQDTIPKLVKISESFTDIDIELLADNLGVKSPILINIIFDHRKELERLGIKLRIRGNLIVKE